MVQLTEHQSVKLDEGLEILETSNRLVIKGSAGTGKTTLVDELIRRLIDNITSYKKVYVTAPTNQAVSILADKIEINLGKIELLTTHSALKISKLINKHTGIETFEPVYNEKNRPLAGVALLIVDESSMIGIKMLEWIEEHATKFKTMVIFIGDDKQLFPVKEKASPVFLGKPISKNEEGEWCEFEEYPSIELTEIIRQKEGNPIIKLSNQMSKIWEYDSKLVEEKGFVYTNDEVKIIERLAKVNGSNELKYLAFHNAVVDDINQRVRSCIYGGNPAKVELGESLLFSDFYGGYYTNQAIKVDTLDIVDIPFNIVIKEYPNFETSKVTLKCYVINGQQVDEWDDGNLKWQGIFVIHEDAENQFKALSKLLLYACGRKELKWTTKSKFLAKFANFKYNHARTVHTSQGSTYQQVILNVGNIMSNSDDGERQRLLYTGITRASDLLILYNT